MNGSPWTFNNHLLVLAVLPNGMDPLEIPLLKVGFWVQIHNLPSVMYSESMAKQFGDFIGEFVEHDAKSVAMGLRNFKWEKRPRLLDKGNRLRSPDLNNSTRLENEKGSTFSTVEPAGQHWLKENRPHVIFLIETKLDARKMERIRRKFGYGNGIDVPSVGTRGGLISAPEGRRRVESWDLLKQLCQNFNGPWVVMSDFNEIVSNQEK
ncbi:hypothetical protein GOBAR_AA12950 [Gossypium barbadense]|uniref:Uncharacterized protein n=1 Tax=Gossypium barbadense TaxID=3634 RepID=A0A2P5XWG2_GOSBA|nr:hypothetical protein GOBAR_AA12950 [Gossypium barbadense]